MSSGLFVSDVNDKNCGGVHSFYDEKTPKKWYDSADPIIITLQREAWQKQKSD